MAARKKIEEFITERQLDLGLTNQDIATGIGYANQNVISMIKKGRTKLPIDKVEKLARVLSVDESKLMRMALNEYMPDTLKVIERCLGATVTKNELALLEIWRDATNHEDPSIPEHKIRGLRAGFVQTMADQSVTE
ncbi:helix-turn-helix domain-containing protein [Vreelandella sulfidaeris]|uniref:HTH cro/C1-type domain-containing protein n=1 Tax=Vreelandella sulfidaeris TaxID=115553 RepID=A0A455U6Q6_9GAMM|nr:hypothetical protein HSBAA_31020 [Halomonas sulfidaeris]